MTDDNERFLSRWSRRKHEERARVATVPAPALPPAVGVPQPAADIAPPLPPLEALTVESDFTPFMSPKVSDVLRRAALKKLFRHPEIDLPDVFEPFSGDWNSAEPIAADMAKRLHDARDALLRQCNPSAEPEPGAASDAGEAVACESEDCETRPSDEAARQDA